MMPHEDAPNFEPVMFRVIEGPKNFSGLVMELQARCKYERLQNGGTWADEQVCRRGAAAHQGRGRESRWLVPEPFLNFVAVWVPVTGTCGDGLPQCRRQ